MKTNPISFLLISMVMVSMLVSLAIITILSLDIKKEWEYGTHTFDAAGLDRISVIDSNGEVRITGSNTSIVVIETKKETYLGKDSLDEINVSVTTIDGEIKVRVTYEMDIPFFTVNIDVKMPWDILVTEARLTNGHLRLTDLKETQKAHVVNGQMTIKDVLIIGDLSTKNGDISISGAEGIGSIDVRNGNIDVTGAGSIGSLDVGNGNINTDRVGTVEDLEVVNGNIDLDIDMIGENGTKAEVQNGDISVSLPANTSFSFDLDAGSGSVKVTGFDPVYSADHRDRKEGEVMGGGPELRCRVESGLITMGDRKEG
jgi:hypothetical protein